jgi:cyclophilin family peptidyl-prolyl cis-trans isomerase
MPRYPVGHHMLIRKNALITVLLPICLLLGTVIFSGCKPKTTADADLQVSSQGGFIKPTPDPTPLLEVLNTEKSATNLIPKQQSQQNNQAQKGPVMKNKLSDFEAITASQVTITTNKGDITFQLFQDKVPLTAANFLNLAKSGFYDGVRFHRVIPDFMAQVGDPLSKDINQQAAWGTGGPGYTIPDEFDSSLKHDSEGIVSMANAGPNTGGSQFFITYATTPWLDGKHAIFGKVTQGMDVLRQIQAGDTIVKISYQ